MERRRQRLHEAPAEKTSCCDAEPAPVANGHKNGRKRLPVVAVS